MAKKTAADLEIREKVGVTAVFPRLNVIKKLEAAFMKEPRTPTDVQVSALLICVHTYALLRLCVCVYVTTVT